LKPSESKTLKDSEVQREVDSLCLGNKIRKLRQRRSMTLQEVSILSSLSKSLISQIENNARVLSMTTLHRTEYTYNQHPGEASPCIQNLICQIDIEPFDIIFVFDFDPDSDTDFNIEADNDIPNMVRFEESVL
jgi:transcriptional regulator with XRE-family HTH domain